MTGPQTDPNVLDFTTDVNRKLSDADRIGFKVDGEPYTLIRPKTGAMISLSLATSALKRIDTTGPVSIDDMHQVASAVNTLIIHIEQPGQAKIRSRLEDPADGLDILDLTPIITRIVEALAARPTIAQPESS